MPRTPRSTRCAPNATPSSATQLWAGLARSIAIFVVPGFSEVFVLPNRLDDAVARRLALHARASCCARRARTRRRTRRRLGQRVDAVARDPHRPRRPAATSTQAHARTLDDAANREAGEDGHAASADTATVAERGGPPLRHPRHLREARRRRGAAGLHAARPRRARAGVRLRRRADCSAGSWNARATTGASSRAGRARSARRSRDR